MLTLVVCLPHGCHSPWELPPAAVANAARNSIVQEPISSDPSSVPQAPHPEAEQFQVPDQCPLWSLFLFILSPITCALCWWSLFRLCSASWPARGLQLHLPLGCCVRCKWGPHEAHRMGKPGQGWCRGRGVCREVCVPPLLLSHTSTQCVPLILLERTFLLLK